MYLNLVCHKIFKWKYDIFQEYEKNNFSLMLLKSERSRESPIKNNLKSNATYTEKIYRKFYRISHYNILLNFRLKA